MKRWIMGGVVTVVLAGAAFAVADAQERAGRGAFGPAQGGPGGMAPRGFGGRGPLGPGPGRAFGGPMLLSGVTNLSDAQREQIKAILDEARQSRQGQSERPGMELHRQLHAELLADAPDEQKIELLRGQITQAAADSLAHQIGVQRKVAQVLTPEQRAEAREHLAQAPPRRGFGRFMALLSELLQRDRTVDFRM